MCSRCRDTLHETLGGVACLRGEWLADRVATRTRIREPWPSTPKAHALEVGAIVDLSRDAILRERFAEDVHRFAVKRWDEIRAGAPVRREVRRKKM